jgi:sugar-specific transcriptional regulator TrmB
VEISQIHNLLEKIGLSEYEAKAYTTLLLIGPSKAGEISKESKIPHSKIYEILEQLSIKQLIETLEGRPKEFKAVSPEIALMRLIEEREKEISKLKGRVKNLSEALKPFKFPEVTYGIWTIKGRKWSEFLNKAAEMIERSRRYIYVVTREFSRTSKLAYAIKSCLRRGVKIRLIGIEEPAEDKYYRAKWYYEHGIQIRIFPTKVHPRILVSDGREVLMRLDGKPTKKDGFLFFSLWSQDESLVKVLDSYVKNLWKNAKPLKL